MKFPHILLALIVPLTWGFGFTFAKAGLEYFPPLLLMGMRFLLAAFILVWFVKIPHGHLWRLVWIAFIAATLQYGLTFSGLARMDATPAVLLVQSEVIFGVIIAAVFLGEKPSLRQTIGIGMAVLGVVIILGAPELGGQTIGISLVLLGAFVWALGQVLIRRFQGALSGFQLTAWLGVMSAPQMLLASCVLDGNPIPKIMAAPHEAWLTVIYLALVMTVVGYSSWYYLLARYPVPMVLPVLLLLPVAAIFGAVTLLDEVLDPVVLTGGAVVIFGVGAVVIEPNHLRNWWRGKVAKQ